MRTATPVLALTLICTSPALSQVTPKTLVGVWAHPDDEAAVGPILARYAREGVKVHIVIATDGAQGAANTKIPRGPELARARAEEARCATAALGINAPILLGFPDGQLGNSDDPGRLFRLTQRLQEELQQLRPDAVITWGPDGGTGHPDHRLVSSIVTQLVRTGAPGLPDRLFYATLPVEGMRAMNPTRGEPPMLIPQARYLTTRVPFAAADFDAALRSLKCHKTQYPEDVVQKLFDVTRGALNGVLPLAPFLSTAAADDLFK